MSTNGANASTKVIIDVEAIASCQLSIATILLPRQGVFFTDAETLAVEVKARDVDNLGIHISVPTLIVKWDGANQSTEGWIPMRRRQDSVFFAEIPLRLRASARSYRLEVVLEDGWDLTPGKQCHLLQDIVTIREPDEALKTWMVLAGALAGCVLLVLGLVMYVKRHADKLQAFLIMILTETGTPLQRQCMYHSNELVGCRTLRLEAP
jgi:hypothetical protein